MLGAIACSGRTPKSIGSLRVPYRAAHAHSAKKIRSQSLLEELDALCDVLENAEHHDVRVRGVSLE
jgi:hypothetical protein